MIRALVAEGTTVLLTTQYLDEADRLASEIAVATPAWHFIAWSIAITVLFAPLAVRRYRRIG